MNIGLKKQYDLLTNEEKNLILAYKSKLSYFINNIDFIFDSSEKLKEFKNKYEEYKEIVFLKENLFIKNTIFKDVDFSDFNKFIENIREISDKLNKLKGKIVTDRDLIVYRATTIRDKKEIYKISNSNLISTTLDINVTDNFYTYDGIDVLYQIKIKKNTPCLITNYSIKGEIYNEKPILKITSNDDQSEIILFKNSIDYNIEDQKWIEDENILVIKIDTNLVESKKIV